MGDLQEFQTNLVPFPRLHFMITSMAPVTTQKKKDSMPNDTRSITELCFSPQSFFTKLPEFDVEEFDECAQFEKNVVMMGNNTAISRVFSDRICNKFDVMYSQRSFVHWFVGEGMEEGEFQEAREDLGFLEKDYLDVLAESVTDEDADDDGSDGESL